MKLNTQYIKNNIFKNDMESERLLQVLEWYEDEDIKDMTREEAEREIKSSIETALEMSSEGDAREWLKTNDPTMELSIKSIVKLYGTAERMKVLSGLTIKDFALNLLVDNTLEAFNRHKEGVLIAEEDYQGVFEKMAGIKLIN